MWKKSSQPPKVLIVGVLCLLISAQGHEADDLIRSTEYGKVEGTQITIKELAKSVSIFLGISFAKPPIGALRFSPPQPLDSWSDVRNATSYPPMCLQDVTILRKLIKVLKLNIPVTTTSEDCLYLNIYIPDNTKEGAGLPVMVWIHGGGLIFGSASMYDGSVLSASQNVVVVTIQYRLGVLGFFSTGDEYASGNWGYLDQVAALQWVQKNIAHFGGDPGRVTIFGESAGAMSVSSHVLSPMSKGLFHRAIMESGVAILPGMLSTSSEAIICLVANLSACDNCGSASIIECLRNKTEEEMLAISKPFKIIPGVVDGQFFPKHPEELLATGTFHHIPSIIGVNNHEYGWFIPMALGISKFKEEMSRESIREILLSPLMNISPETVHEMMEKYLGKTEDPKELRAQFQEMMGDLVFVSPALRVAKHHQNSSSPVYFYEFQHRPSMFKGIKPDFVKADHGDELRFVFGGPLLGRATPEEKLFSQKIMAYWANFARNGDPNGADLLYWPAYNENEEYLQLGLELSVGRNLKAEKMEFWLKSLPQKKKAAMDQLSREYDS